MKLRTLLYWNVVVSATTAIIVASIIGSAWFKKTEHSTGAWINEFAEETLTPAMHRAASDALSVAKVQAPWEVVPYRADQQPFLPASIAAPAPEPSRIVQIQSAQPQPKVAAAVVNHMVQPTVQPVKPTTFTVSRIAGRSGLARDLQLMGCGPQDRKIILEMVQQANPRVNLNLIHMGQQLNRPLYPMALEPRCRFLNPDKTLASIR